MDDKSSKQRYRDGLDTQTRQRYEQKISLIDGKGPYELNKREFTADVNSFPAVTYIDILNYLIHTKSAYTFEELKTYKSLEAINQLCFGWVRDVQSMAAADYILVTGRTNSTSSSPSYQSFRLVVEEYQSYIDSEFFIIYYIRSRHSQRMNETFLRPWIIARKNGIIEAAHCDCMAGLGETCTHVGALLFHLESVNRLNAQRTVTQEKAYWLLPSAIDKVPYSEIKDIDFTSVVSKKRKLDCEINGEEVLIRSSLRLPDTPELTSAEKEETLEKLYNAKSNASVLTVSSKYQKNFLPKILQDGHLPKPLVNLKDDRYFEMPANKLQKECESLFESMEASEEQAKNVERITREQSKSKEWHRLGLITASNMKAVCSASVDNPAVSTVNSICGVKKFRSKASVYGCKHEQDALRASTGKMKTEHENFIEVKTGLCINPLYPHMGASPDCLVSCDCCGDA